MQEDVSKMIDGRNSAYGDAAGNMERTALLWNTYLRLPAGTITGADASMMNVLAKIDRFKTSPDYLDNSKDAVGYIEIAQRCIGDAMIEAETVKEYQAKKAARAARVEDVKQDISALLTEAEVVQIRQAAAQAMHEGY